ncbi:hypothetical protein CDD81_2278 [Ophiocordyceps australis]|uniref:C2H2-type domain-containing protein n=1 Tax=Ophiocordyceps australis TaxID=1399860 RepID=A0A2C5XK71_9HYPO|nr:hypothetical protein CDD81_2278 [Ophiocordyceps australis]
MPTVSASPQTSSKSTKLLPIIPLDNQNQLADKEQLKILSRSSHRYRRGDSDSGLGSSIHSQDQCAQTEEQLSKLNITPRPSPATGDVKVNTRPIQLKSSSRRRIFQSIIYPLLSVPHLKSFHPLVLEIPQRMQQKLIVCLRDVEKHLLLVAPDKTKDATQYLDFCFASIQCIQATVSHTSEGQQILAGDRPYSNGYFIDLTDQIKEYARQFIACDSGDIDTQDFDKAAGIQLFGGIAETGRPAQLVRLNKDGTAISLADGKPVDLSQGPIQFKRSLSVQLDDSEEIRRSMARPRKNAKPEQLSPKKCPVPGCNKTFERRCDLTKHDRTHSRPYKCGDKSCKFHEIGWANEKERDRHMNDKHSKNPTTYPCHYPNCAYKSKRKSNCKQHMEKNHGWEYRRTKSNGLKKSEQGSSSSQSPHLPSPASTEVPRSFSQSNGSMQQPSDQVMVVRPSRQLSLSSSTGTTPTLRSMSTPRSPPMDTPTMNQDTNTTPTTNTTTTTNTALRDGAGCDPIFGGPSSSLDLDQAMYVADTLTFNEQYPAWHDTSNFIMQHEEDLYAAPVRVPDAGNIIQQCSKLAPQLPLQSMAATPSSVQLMVQPQFAWPEIPEIMSNLIHDGLETPFALDPNESSQLYPAALVKEDSMSLLAEPSAHLFSQTTEPEIFRQGDWTPDFPCLGEPV